MMALLAMSSSSSRTRKKFTEVSTILHQSTRKHNLQHHAANNNPSSPHLKRHELIVPRIVHSLDMQEAKVVGPAGKGARHCGRLRVELGVANERMNQCLLQVESNDKEIQRRHPRRREVTNVGSGHAACF